MKLPEFKEKMHDLGYVSKIININPDIDRFIREPDIIEKHQKRRNFE